MSLREVLLSGAADWGLELAPQSLERFEAYYAFLSEANQVMDLPAVMGEEETARRHFLDSLSLLRFADLRDARLIDVGSGAGFPGLPLKLAEPSIRLTLLDAQQKRVDFLSSLCEKLGVSVRCVHARAEEAALEASERDGYDYAVSRAVARLNMLAELCLPFVRRGFPGHEGQGLRRGAGGGGKRAPPPGSQDGKAGAVQCGGGGARPDRDPQDRPHPQGLPPPFRKNQERSPVASKQIPLTPLLWDTFWFP